MTRLLCGPLRPFGLCKHNHAVSSSAVRCGPTHTAGLNIADGRGNAVRLLAITVAALMDSNPQAQLMSIKGGDKRNALPREASAVLAVGYCCASVAAHVSPPAPLMASGAPSCGA
jgi:hypothetical protein